MRKTLMVLLAVSIAVGVAWVLWSSGGGDPVRPAADGRTLSGVRGQGPGAGRSGSGKGREEGRARRGEVARERTVRRFESRAQRERVLALIASMARARRESAATAGEEGEDGGTGEEGTLPREAIQKGVQAVIEDIRRCYDSVLETDPDLGGRLVVDFEIVGEPDAGGVVDDVRIAASSDEAMSGHEGLTECMLDAVYSIELPPPENGGRVKVTYPFVMTPDRGGGAPRRSGWN